MRHNRGNTSPFEGLNVLFVDDNRGDYELVRVALAELQAPRINLDWASSYVAGKEAASSGAYDACLVDCHLGPDDGVALIREITDTSPELPLIVLTGVHDPQIDHRAQAAGAIDYLVKGEADAHTIERTIRYAIDRRQSEARLSKLAMSDPLTGLANRAALGEHLVRAMALAKRTDQRLALLMVDLDGFKTVNDSLGHDAGDAVLKIVGERLRRCCRQSDLVARLGGDEFAVVADNVVQQENAGALANKIVRAISDPISLTQHSVLVGASVGIAMFPGDAADGETLVRCADLATYRAKRSGRGRHSFFDETLQEEAQRQHEATQDVRHAIVKELFTTHFQPIVDLTTGRVVSMEALLRWPDETMQSVTPADAVTIAETSGQIVPLSEQILLRSCLACKQWQAQGLDGVKVAVNVSAQHVQSDGFVTTVSETLAKVGLPATLLDLEITEACMLDAFESAVKHLRQLGEQGVQFAIDDFGTGYSSLAYLAELPVHKIKIDRRFVSQLDQGGRARTIVKAIVGLARNLDLGVTAEGIETLHQLQVLTAEGCAEGQGFLIARPAPIAKLLSWPQASLQEIITATYVAQSEHVAPQEPETTLRLA